MPERRILFCRSGGGLPGLDIHVGIWQALSINGVVATHCHGTSAGAIVSAMDSAGWSSLQAAKTVQQYTAENLIDWRWLWRTRSLFIANVARGKAMLRELDRLLPSQWEDYHKPLSTWTVQAGSCLKINSFRDTIAHSPEEAVAMSARIPAVFPPIQGVDRRWYIDGGLRNNLPLPPDWREYDEVWLLIASGLPSNTEPASTVLGNALRVFRTLMADQILDVLEQVEGAPNVHVIWPKLRTPSILEFDHSLIAQARNEAIAQIKAAIIPVPFSSASSAPCLGVAYGEARPSARTLSL